MNAYSEYNRKKKPRQVYWYGAASLIGIFLIAGGLLYFLQFQNKVYITGFGETKAFHLPDGSEVMLNANSRLTYRQSIFRREEERAVDLKGEAYFTVRHNENDRPFLVHTDEVGMEVLGTRFNVKSRRGETQVFLNEGKVRLLLESSQKIPKKVVMTPGELARINQKGKSEVQMARAKKYISWTRNELVFDEMPLRRITQMVEDQYGLKFKVIDRDLLNRKFTATYPADNVNILLKALERSFGVDITRKGKQVIIRHKENAN